MAQTGKTGEPARVRFALFAADGITKATGEAGSVTVGFDLNGTLLIPSFAVLEIPGLPGEYEVVFTPAAIGDYTVTIAHPGVAGGQPVDLAETIQVFDASLQDVAQAIAGPIFGTAS